MDEVNKYYRNKELLKQVKAAFLQNKDCPSVALHGFLTPDGLQKARVSAKKWVHSTIPDQHSYATCKAKLGLADFVKRATGKKPIKQDSMLLRHRDFTLLHDEKKQRAGVIGLLFLFDWNKEWGGDFVLVKDGETLKRFTPKKNTLLLVWRKQGVQSFVKYVNHKAGENVVAFLSVA